MGKKELRRLESERPEPRPGTRMLSIPTCAADPMRLAEESIEQLRRSRAPRVVKTSKRKRKAAR
jgi:hypothetical protein